MTGRKWALETMKVAGYHGDRTTFTRTYIENRVSREIADKAWTEGKRLKEKGEPCACYECRKGKQ